MPNTPAIEEKVASAAPESANTPTVESTADPSAVESAAKADTLSMPPITMTGCLELRDDRFQLRNASGENAPTSRNWKWGFLKKSAASIEIVEAPDALDLSTFLGQRVSATGTLVDREMQLVSLRSAGGPCR
jgi:hypothetical protein